MTVLDSEGADLWPLVDAVALDDGVPAELLLALLWAESDLRRTAERWGTPPEGTTMGEWSAQVRRAVAGHNWADIDAILNHAWPDVSFGLGQQIVQTAGRHGVGDGSREPANVLAVRDLLFDRALSIDLSARILAGCLASPSVQAHERPDLAALVEYNAGWLPPAGHNWWRVWAANVVRYEEALAWAHKVVSEGS